MFADWGGHVYIFVSMSYYVCTICLCPAHTRLLSPLSASPSIPDFTPPGGVARQRDARDLRGEVAIGQGQATREAAGRAEGGRRKVERVSNLDQVARAGDVFLFRCKGLLSRLQRWVSRSEWDHVGMVRAVCGLMG